MPIFRSPKSVNDKNEKTVKQKQKFIDTELVSNSAFQVLGQLYILFFNYCRFAGLFCIRFLRSIKKGTIEFYHTHLKKHFYKLGLGWLRILKWFSKLQKLLLSHIYQFVKFFNDVWRVIKKGYQAHPEKGFFHRLCDAGSAFVKGVRNNSHIIITAANYALPIIAILVFANIVSYVFSLNYAVKVEYNGQQIGYIQNEAVYKQAETKLQERLLYQPQDETLDDVPKFAVTVVNPLELKTDTQLTDTIIESSNENIVQATGVFIDGKFLGAVKDCSAIKNKLENALDKYKTNKSGERVEFTRDIKLESGLYLLNNITDEDNVLQTLSKKEKQDVFYTVAEGDTPSDIAAKNNMDLDELVALNPNILDSCLIGQQVYISKSQPYLSVKSIRTQVYTQPIPYTTQYNLSKGLYEGQKKVTTEGKPGKQSVTAEVSYVNGIEISRNIISTSAITQPVTEQIAKGTKIMPRISGNVGPSSNYGLTRPITNGYWYISQTYGRTQFSRWHNGIDIAFRNNGYGTPIRSVLPGTVVYAGRSGSYGLLVRVNHGNGMETWYAHCSKIIVSPGDTVVQGQQIANAGSTGNSSGVHLHFRVIVNGVERNPLNYLPNMF